MGISHSELKHNQTMINIIVLLAAKAVLVKSRAYSGQSEDGLFRPSLELSSFNSSTFAVSSLPMQPLGPELNRVQDRQSISFEEDFNDIGNIDYSVPWGEVGGQREALEEDMRRVRKLLEQEDDRLYYDSVDFTPDDISTNFIPSSVAVSSPLTPLSVPPLSPSVSPDIDVVVKGLPGAGPRLTGAKTTFSPPLHHSQPQYHPHFSIPWSGPHPQCDDKIEPTCLAIVPGFPGCLEDDDYPTTSIKLALYQDPLVAKKWTQQPETYEHPADDVIGYHNHNDVYSRQHWENYDGFLCASSVEYVRPMRLRNTEGRWRVIVNKIGFYDQTVRVETCLNNGSNCRLLPPCFNTQCSQIHTFHRLLAYNPCKPEDGLFIDTFRLPSACSCAIRS